MCARLILCAGKTISVSLSRFRPRDDVFVMGRRQLARMLQGQNPVLRVVARVRGVSGVPDRCRCSGNCCPRPCCRTARTIIGGR